MLIRGWERRLRKQSEANAMECKDVVKMTSIEGLRCGVNGFKSSQYKIDSLLNWKPMKWI